MFTRGADRRAIVNVHTDPAKDPACEMNNIKLNAKYCYFNQ